MVSRTSPVCGWRQFYVYSYYLFHSYGSVRRTALDFASYPHRDPVLRASCDS